MSRVGAAADAVHAASRPDSATTTTTPPTTVVAVAAAPFTAASASAPMDLEALRRSVQAQQRKEVPVAPTAQLLRVPEVMDDFVRSFLHRNGMTATLQAFEVEWYTHTSARTIAPSNPMVPDNYRETLALMNRIEILERDLRQHAELTTRVTQQWSQAKKDREYHRVNHQRIVQENARLSRLLKQAGQHAEEVNPTLTESRIRCEQLLKAKSLLTIERDKLRREKEQLETRVAELEGQLASSGDAEASNTRTSAVAASKGKSAAGAAKPRAPAGSRGGGGRTTAPQQSKSKAGTAAAARRDGSEAKSSTTTSAAANAAEDVDDVFVWPADQRTPPPLPPTGPTSASWASTGASGRLPGPSPTTAAAAAAASPATEWAEQSCFTAHTMPVSSIALHPFKPVLASGCDDGTWRLSALPGGEAIVSGQGHTNWISCIGLHPRGTMLATGSGDKTVKLWDFASNTCAATLAAHTEGVWDLDFQDTGLLLASAGLDKTARVWDVERGVCRQSLRGHQEAVNGVRWLPCTNLLLTGSADKTVAVWDARLSTKVQSFTGHRAAVLAVAAGPAASNLFASCDTQGAVTLWDARRMTQLLRVECGPQPANAIAIDGAGHFLAVASDDGTIKMIDVEETVVTELVGHEGPVQSVAFDVTNSHYLVSGGSDRTVRYWC